MAEQDLINPYPKIGELHVQGMESIIVNYTSSPDNLNSVICGFIKKSFNYDDKTKIVLEDVELASIFTIAQNAYINNESLGAISGQVNFVNLLIHGIKKIAPLDIPQYIANIEDNITKSKLSQEQKMPLFFATSVGLANYTYWMAQITDAESGWQTYFNSNAAVNIANVPFWVSATMQATIYFCFKGDYFTGEAEPPKMAGPDFVTALTASLAVGAGKVIYGWVQKLKLTAINNFNPINGKIASVGNSCNCNNAGLQDDWSKLRSYNINDRGIDFGRPNIGAIKNITLDADFLTGRNTGKYNVGTQWTGDVSGFHYNSIFPNPIQAVNNPYAGITAPDGAKLINDKIFINNHIAFNCPNGGDLELGAEIQNAHIDGGVYITDPITGQYGTWGSMQKLFFSNTYGAPNLNWYVSDVNLYLDGARYLYNILANSLPPNQIITTWVLYGGWGVVPSGSGYPDQYIVSHIIHYIVHEIYCTDGMPR